MFQIPRFVWSPLVYGGGIRKIPSGSLTTLAYQASATSSNSSTITVPAGVQAGDLLVLADVARNTLAAPPAAAYPSGFTSIVTATLGGLNDARLASSYKIADGTEGGTSLTGMSGSDGAAKALYVFRGNTAIASVSLSSPTSEASDGNPSAQTIAASGGTPPLVAIACYSVNSAFGVDPRTFTVGGSAAKDGEINAAGNNIDSWLAYKIYNSSPADISIDMDDEGGDNILAGVYIACA